MAYLHGVGPPISPPAIDPQLSLRPRTVRGNRRPCRDHRRLRSRYGPATLRPFLTQAPLRRDATFKPRSLRWPLTPPTAPVRAPPPAAPSPRRDYGRRRPAC